ncbi:histidinol-phosphate aminotransferase [Thermogymnomonas acidicola]|uniref:Histidinol-phosphate aminotransferase n=1 Tax=Thermogymnomonas acidicola TaxID=399579 RepID=A0AA37BRS4_9ARCH|nr:histidinol-phosphate transaminase [Thermogymnomonas acidicola]GGM75920.1 histidinol-phosphate aminotransferase [Thermogymnomonas acidicola]
MRYQNRPSGLVRLDRNESPFDIPAEVKEEAVRAMLEREWNRYPDAEGEGLRQDIADSLGLGMGNVVVGNGSDDLLPEVITMFRRIYVYEPTFEMYRFFAEKHGVQYVPVWLSPEFRFPEPPETGSGDLLVVCRPNNPTGTEAEEDIVLSALERGTNVLLDEAYWDFSGHTMVEKVSDYPNLMVLRTFSKAFSMAGVRVGYLVASEETASRVLGRRAPFPVNVLSECVARAMLRHRDLVRKTVDYIVAERERMEQRLGELCVRSTTNFFLVKGDMRERLAERGILVRKLSGRLSEMSRVTVGERRENDAFLEAYLELVSGAGGRLAGP